MKAYTKSRKRINRKFIHILFWKGCVANMEEKKFAELDQEQLKKINDLERKIGVTLIAYDLKGIQQGDSGYHNSTHEDHSS